MENRKINEGYRAISETLIDTELGLAYIKDSSVKITYLESDLQKKADKDKLVLGECEKAQKGNYQQRWVIR